VLPIQYEATVIGNTVSLSFRNLPVPPMATLGLRTGTKSAHKNGSSIGICTHSSIQVQLYGCDAGLKEYG
jgi:hypothetical protein